MNKIAITVDSSCDVPVGFLEKHEIFVFHINMLIGSEEYSEISAEEVLKKVQETGIMPKTSAVTTAVYEDKFAELLKNYDEVIHLSISSKASCSFENSKRAADAFNGKVFAIDTKSLSGGIGLLLNKIVIMREEGLSASEIVAKAEGLVDKLQLSFVVDTMDFLHKGGRCSSLQYIGAKILKIHPEIVMKDGQLKSGEKYIGKVTKCYNKYVEDLAKKYPDYDKSVCYLTFSPSDLEYIEGVKAKVKEHFNFEEIYEVNASATITCHCGPNTVGVLFIKE